MSDIMLDHEDFYMIRLQCDCMSSMHALDMTLDFWSDDGKEFMLEFNEKYVGSRRHLHHRIGAAIKVLFGREIWTHGFVVRDCDVVDVLDFFRKSKVAAEASAKEKQEDPKL